MLSRYLLSFLAFLNMISLSVVSRYSVMGLLNFWNYMWFLNKFEIISANISQNTCHAHSPLLLTFSNWHICSTALYSFIDYWACVYLFLVHPPTVGFSLSNCSVFHWTFILHWLINCLFVPHNVVLITDIFIPNICNCFYFP